MQNSWKRILRLATFVIFIIVWITFAMVFLQTRVLKNVHINEEKLDLKAYMNDIKKDVD